MFKPMTEFKKPARYVGRVFIHCSDSDKPEHDSPDVIERWHRQRGFNGIGYHYYISQKGIVWVCRPVEVVPAAQAPHNRGSIAICLGGRNNFTEAQFAALKEFCQIILNELPAVTFHGHREVNRGKTCPNFDYKQVLGLNEAGSVV